MDLWRAFPWDRAAREGERFSPSYVNPLQTDGRFDLGCKPCVLYTAGSAEQALAEKLQRYRGRSIGPLHLQEWGHPIAVAPLSMAGGALQGAADLCEARVLVRLDLKPNHLMSWDRKVTQAISRRIHDSGAPAFHCWSSLRGDWVSTILFLDRLPAPRMAFGPPELVSMESPLLHRVAEALNLELPASQRRRFGRQ